MNKELKTKVIEVLKELLNERRQGDFRHQVLKEKATQLLSLFQADRDKKIERLREVAMPKNAGWADKNRTIKLKDAIEILKEE